MTGNTLRAAIYVRISKDRTGQGLGVARQEEDCRQLAAAKGWEVADVYVDNDVSATNRKRPRPAWRRLLAALEAGTYDALVCWHNDRLYRTPRDLEALIDATERHRPKIATVTAGDFDLDTPSGRMVAGILANVARQEVEHKTERWRRSVRQSREAGRPYAGGPRMYGWSRDGHIIESEAATIRHIAAALLEGKTVATVTRELNAAGITTATGGRWQTQSVRKLMTNPRLAGHMTLRGEIVGRSSWPPILDDDTWTVAAAAARGRGRSPVLRVALLPGLVMCGRCGQRLYTASRRGRVRTYRCAGDATRPGSDGCGGISVPAEYVEEIVEGYAQARLSDPRVRAELAHMHAQPGRVAEAEELRHHIAVLDDALAVPGADVPVILAARRKAADQLEEAEASLAAIPPAALSANGGIEWPDDLGRRRALIQTVVKAVHVDPARRRGGRFDPERVRITAA